MLVAAALGLASIARPMRYDEAFSALFFVEPNWAAAFYYPLPNNHFAYTVLERLMNSPTVISSFIAGITMVNSTSSSVVPCGRRCSIAPALSWADGGSTCMQREMETAIAKELYERAAELRDAIKLLKTQKQV